MTQFVAWGSFAPNEDCPFFNFDFVNGEGRCKGCGEKCLTKTGKLRPDGVWCGEECRFAANSNHGWATARSVTIRDARRKVGIPAWSMERRAPCNSCGKLTSDPEVNHIIPRNGNKAHDSCLHHLDNLEVVCHQCHVKITRVQKSKGLITR